ncbi:MAG: pyridoxamine 5'-phosphate oxidase family protein [Thermotaleaceae bacterium]
MNQAMTAPELKAHIEGFLKEHREASLATSLHNIPRSSPVQYTIGEDMNIYIFSAGGEKFQAIEENPNVCLLVNTEFINHRKIKGVQVFGKAVTSIQHPELFDEGKAYAPDPMEVEHERGALKAIKITPTEIVYLDAIEEGDRTKQILKNGQVTIKEEGFVTFH